MTVVWNYLKLYLLLLLASSARVLENKSWWRKGRDCDWDCVSDRDRDSDRDRLRGCFRGRGRDRDRDRDRGCSWEMPWYW